MTDMDHYSTHNINILNGACAYRCRYCYGPEYIKKYNLQEKYSGPPRLDERILRRRYKKGDIVFVTSMTDPFNPAIPLELHYRIFDWMREPRNREAKFLYLTKNPNYYGRFIQEGKPATLDSELFPRNLQLGVTIETNRDAGYRRISNAPLPSQRIEAMKQLREWTDNDLFISIEPILKFDLEPFIQALKEINPVVIAIGRDMWNKNLPEPTPREFEALCDEIETFTTLHRK